MPREEKTEYNGERAGKKVAIFLNSAIKFSDAESRDYYLSRTSELVNCVTQRRSIIAGRRIFFSINRRWLLTRGGCNWNGS